MSQPIISDRRPEQNHPGIVPNTDIYFTIQDADGVNIGTLNVWANSLPVMISSVPQPGYSGSITKRDPLERDYAVNINPNSNFLFGDEVTIYIYVEDKLGNPVNDYYKFTIIDNPDNTAPITIPAPRGGCFNSAVTISLDVLDASTTQTYYTLTGADPLTSGQLYTGPFQLASEGSFTLKYYSRDNDNASASDDNVEEVKSEVYKLDFTAPILTIEPEPNKYFQPQNVTITTNEDATIYYTVDGRDPKLYGILYKGPIHVSSEGINKVRYFAIDLCGNETTVEETLYEISYATSNFAPSNAMVMSPHTRGKLDVVWDDMQHYDGTVRGYNVYRSYFYNGPYVKLNDNLVTTTAYRDEATDMQILKEDVSSQFQQTRLINRNASDPFVGNRIDRTKWKEYDSKQIMVQCNSLYVNDPIGNHTISELFSTFILQGDFDISVGIDCIKWEFPDQDTIEIGLGVGKVNGDRILITKTMTQTDEYIESKQIINGTQDLPIRTANNVSQLRLRITRNAGVINVLYVDPSGTDVLQHSYLNSFLDDLHVVIYAKTSTNQVEVRYYDFEVKEGQVAIIHPLNPQKEYLIKTQHRPIVDKVTGPTGNTKTTDLFLDATTNKREFVRVFVDGIQAKIKYVNGHEGEIILDTDRYWDYIHNKFCEPVIPNETSIVTVEYYTRNHDVDHSLRKPLYYKVTLEHDCGETSLKYAKAITVQSDSLDWIYAESLRRNSWLLDQAGEDVLLFVKSRSGERCKCYIDNERTHRQPNNDCEECYGTGFLPPYAQPVCIKISPAMAEQKLMQTDRGMRLDYVTEVWTITPHILNQRDFLVRRDGTILAIGPQTVPEVRGRRLEQQHFTIQPVDRTDVRYDYLDGLAIFDRRKEYKEIKKCIDYVSEKKNDSPTPCKTDTKGRTITFENHTF